MKTIGVRMNLLPSDNLLGQLKQELLLFDKIGVIDLSRGLKTYQELNSYPDELAFFSALKNNNYLFELSYGDYMKRVKTKTLAIMKPTLKNCFMK
jgi:hypothetical protein